MLTKIHLIVSMSVFSSNYSVYLHTQPLVLIRACKQANIIIIQKLKVFAVRTINVLVVVNLECSLMECF